MEGHKMKKIAASLLVAASLFGSDYNYELTPVVGYDIAEGNINLENYLTYGLEAQYNGVDSAIKPELSVLYAKPDYEDGYTGDTDVWRVALNGVYEYDKKGAIIPMAKFGVGYENLSDNKSGNTNSLFGDVGVGAKIPFTDMIALKLEAIYMAKFNNFRWDNNLVALAGLNIAFGASARQVEEVPVKEEKVEETAAVAAVPVVLDDDKDGVPNAKDKCPLSNAGAKVDANGCEFDSDKDGVVDFIDKCPNTPAGVAVDAKGCTLDSDGDGVVDSQDKCANTPKGQEVNSDGCPHEINLHINFENASAKVDSASMVNVDKMANFLNLNKNYSIKIVGYTDSKGSASFNKKLSQRRADAVRKLLIEKGVEPSRVSAEGRGEANPIADNATAEGRAQNRRIEAELIRK